MLVFQKLYPTFEASNMCKQSVTCPYKLLGSCNEETINTALNFLNTLQRTTFGLSSLVLCFV